MPRIPLGNISDISNSKTHLNPTEQIKICGKSLRDP